MSRKGIGRMMKEALEGRLPPEGERAKSRGLMMNPLRRALYSELTRFPATPVSPLGKDLGMSQSTATWHTGKLLLAGFLDVSGTGRTRYYFPTKLVEKRHLPLLSILAKPATRAVMNNILSKPNISQGELAEKAGLPRQTVRYHTDALEEFGVVEAFRQDRHRRFESTGVLEKLSERRGREVIAFKSNLLKLLKADGVNPAVIRTRTHSVLIRIELGDGKAVFEAFTNPFVTALGKV